MNEPLLDALRLLGGVATSAELKARMGVSQPTVSRALTPLLRDGRVIKVGAARSQQYLLARHIDGVGSEIPLMRVDAQGKASAFGRMVALPGGIDGLIRGLFPDHPMPRPTPVPLRFARGELVVEGLGKSFGGNRALAGLSPASCSTTRLGRRCPAPIRRRARRARISTSTPTGRFIRRPTSAVA